jgi:hypothetical protein
MERVHVSYYVDAVAFLELEHAHVPRPMVGMLYPLLNLKDRPEAIVAAKEKGDN